MIKISDLWFAFEHLIKISDSFLPIQGNSKMDFLEDSFFEENDFQDFLSDFNSALYQKVLHTKEWRKDIYIFLNVLSKNTRGGTQTAVKAVHTQISKKEHLEPKHIFAIAYALRNLYVHQGVAAALGSQNYKVKRVLYELIFDAISFFCVKLGAILCTNMLEQMPEQA